MLPRAILQRYPRFGIVLAFKNMNCKTMIKTSSIMRRLLPMLLAAFSLTASAQSVSFSLISTPCNNDGVLGITVTGLTPPLTVNWQTAGSAPTLTTHMVTGSTDALTGYSGGPVTVTVSNGSGTTSSSYAGAPPFTFSFASVAAVCPAMGAASASVSGGTAPYTYEWYRISSAAIVGTTVPISLPAGVYGLTVTDAAGCKYGTKASPVFDTVQYFSPFSISVAATPANCNNGTATVTVSPGATLPISCNWSNGANTASLTALHAGLYGVTVTDALGCVSGMPLGTATMGFSNTVTVPQAYAISVPLTATPASCAATDGAVTATPSGGTAPYTYLWNNGATTQTQTGIPTGFYEVLVTDANGCTGIGTGTGLVSSPSPLTVTSSASPSLCTIPSGNATVTASGGLPPYSIQWYTTPAHTGTTATGLAAGTYTYKVTDASGCSITSTVTVPPVNSINTNFSAIPAACSSSTGTLMVTPTGGVAPYTYFWNTGATAPSLAGAAPGTYTVTITDNMSCKVTAAHVLPSNSPVGAGVLTIPASCILSNDGSIIATPFGGSAPYAYGWSSGGTTSAITGLTYGPYWLNVTDASGCSIKKYSYVPYNDTETNCFCTITGTVFNDTNNNCTQDVGEAGIPNIQVLCSGRGYTYTDANGNYTFRVPSGSYVITESVEATRPLASCQSNGIMVTTIAMTGCVNTVNFANTSTPIHDIHISTWDVNRAVPGNPYRQVTIITNEGTVREDSIMAVYNAGTQLYTPSIIPSNVFTGGPVYATNPGSVALNPGAAATYYMNYNTPANIALGTNITFRDTAAYLAPLSNWMFDNTPYNNIGAHVATIVSTNNPNFKDVAPKGSGSNGTIFTTDSVLEYMVHYQNTLNVGVQNVIVVDTLDNNLDWTSLRPVYASFPAKIAVTQSGAFRIATFTFSNINLTTQAVNDARSQGMFTYTIKQRPGLTAGTQFRNRAAIYMDYNEPFLTNYTLNTIGIPIDNVNEIGTKPASSFVVYPNPASSSFTAVINSDATHTTDLSVCDVTGKVMISQTLALAKGAQNATTDISQLAPGIYFIVLNNNGKTQTQKLVIIK
jgi:uncharacterized repeat protein (TIGR01451 family)